MHNKFGPQGVLVFGLNEPAFGEDAGTLDAFRHQAGITYPLLDAHGTLGLLDFPGDNTFPFPRDAIVGPDGKIVYESNTYDSQALWNTVRRLIGAAP